MASARRKSSVSATSTRSARQRTDNGNQFVICVENSGYPASLEVHKIYRVLRDQAATKDGDLRVVDESGEDYLYPARYFVPIALPKKVELKLLKAS